MGTFPCPHCNAERGALDADCEVCGWSRDGPVTDPSASEPDYYLADNRQCSCCEKTQPNSWFIKAYSAHIVQIVKPILNGEADEETLARLLRDVPVAGGNLLYDALGDSSQGGLIKEESIEHHEFVVCPSCRLWSWTAIKGSLRYAGAIAPVSAALIAGVTGFLRAQFYPDPDVALWEVVVPQHGLAIPVLALLFLPVCLVIFHLPKWSLDWWISHLTNRLRPEGLLHTGRENQYYHWRRDLRNL